MPPGPALPLGLPAPLLTAVGGALLATGTLLFAVVTDVGSAGNLEPIAYTGTTAAGAAGYLLWVRAGVTGEDALRWVALAFGLTMAVMLLESMLGGQVVPTTLTLEAAGPYVASHLLLPVGALLATFRLPANRMALGLASTAAVALVFALPGVTRASAVLGGTGSAVVTWSLVALWAAVTVRWMVSTGEQPRWTEAWVSVALALGTAEVLFTVTAGGAESLRWAAAAMRWMTFVLPAGGLVAGVVRVHRALEHRTRELAAESRAHQQANAELARRNAELDAYAGVLAHDLRAPVAISSWNLQTALSLLGTDELDDDVEQLLQAVQTGHERALALIEELLALARARDQRLDLEALDVAQLVDVVVATLPDVDRGHVEVDADELVVGDRTALRQTLQNLIGNAAAYRREDKELRVEVRVVPDDAAWRIVVGDAGVGIAPEDRERVFTPFERLGDTAERTSGTGLGLAICQQLVQRHGGSIDVSGSHLGGAQFTITLPRRHPAEIDLRDAAAHDSTV